MKLKISMHRIYKRYNKEYVESSDFTIDASTIPEVKEREKNGFYIHSVLGVNDV